MDCSVLKLVIETLACLKCFSCNLELTVQENVGFCSNVSVECKNCAEQVTDLKSSNKISDSNVFDVNRRMTKAFKSIGQGYASLEHFSMVMNIHP